MKYGYQQHRKKFCLYGVPYGLFPSGLVPLDKTSQYGSYTEAQTYAQTSPLAYVGQVLSVVENGESKQYQIKDTAGTLEPLGGLGDIGVATDEEVEEMLTEVFSDDDNT
nr:MAG TPA: hypothetical protein [Caudoviricetes sp.]